MTRLKSAAIPLSLIVLGLAFWWFQALTGYNPTDDGFILAQSWRILNGEVPHVDFTSPRPLGSALLHVLDVLPGWGTLAFSRLIVTAQLVWVAFISVELFDRRRVLNPVGKVSLIVVAFLLNVGVWPVMAWHTIDGIFIGITAIWLATRDAAPGWRSRMLWAGTWLVAGFAPLVKQGFVVVPLCVLVIYFVSRKRQALLWLPIGLLPGLLYLLVTLRTPGGLLAQLYSGSSGELTRPWITLVTVALQSRTGIAVVVAVVIAVLLRGRYARRVPYLRTIAPLVAVAGPIVVGIIEGFSLAGSWAFLATLALLLTAALLVRDLTTAAIVGAVLLIGYGSALSWGATSPTLLAGTFVVGSALLLAPEVKGLAPLTLRNTRRLNTGVAVVLAIVLIPISVVVRDSHVYMDRDAAELTASSSAPGFALIRLSPQTVEYIDSVQRCIGDEKPAEVAVLPDSAGLYPLLRLHNPFALDWWLWAELSADHEQRVDQAIERLNARDDWTVLVGTLPMPQLPTLTVDEVTEQINPPAPDLVESIVDRLDGREFTCDSFVGVAAKQ